MIRGIYISCGSDAGFSGVNKKIVLQIEELSKYFATQHILVKKREASIFEKLMWRLPLGSFGRDYKKALSQIMEHEELCFFYIRASEWDRAYCRFLGEIRNKYKDALIMMEMPTYPSGIDLLFNKSMWPFFIKDRIYRKQAKKYVDAIFNYNTEDRIYGINTIRIKNGTKIGTGADLEAVCGNSGDCDEIHLLAVAQMQAYHGYERIIHSIYRYIRQGGERKVFLHLVGDGAALKRYKKLVADYHIEQKVLFYGNVDPSGLLRFYRLADIGLGSFGWYKMGVETSSNLKIREYLNYGLPVISAVQEDLFTDQDCLFYMQCKNDSSEIQMEDILSFYDKLHAVYEKDELRRIIHQYAADNADISKTFSPVIECVRTHMKGKGIS